ncbi:TetR family transcriptional regulator [Conexibacter sp. CPCC 206217]|uniref:TetR family transcriptional regulator n=1 Tax=Conexibacter sp. CPCC 206217 TaxID=3064574 RepID=UPI00272806FC|nr:TetR family transcriptional regulator [Conexibacter sp. CPCC 206217]MDO8213303.1 TetR family transcriptional regulator [Conexibacter sp. CPCC 206217]
MGIRERKKERTREAIEREALRLFAEHGYTETTISEIAEAAEIGRRTFFSYFPSKEAVVLADLAEFIDDFEAAMEARDPDQDFVAALREWISCRADVEADAHDEQHIARKAARRRLIEGSDELQARERQLLSRAERIVAIQVAAELGDDPGALRPRFVGAALTATVGALSQTDDDSSADHTAKSMDGLDDVLAFIEAGLEALRARRAAATSTNA